MQKILTVTLNPALDLATSVDHVVSGPKLRCGPTLTHPGGGGVNVARMITELGGPVRALVAVAGATGQMLVDLIQSEGVVTVPVEISGETRRNLAVTDESTGEQYRFSLQSDLVSADDEAKLIDAISGAVAADDLLVLSGGIAPGMSVNVHERIKLAVSEKTDRLVLDTCDPALSQVLSAPVTPFFLLRLDQLEAAGAAGHHPATLADSLSFAQDLVDRGVARNVVTGRGSEGSVLVGETGRWFCHAAKVIPASKVGAGDALVGGMSHSLAQGSDMHTALQFGVAAASAMVETPGTEICRKERVEELIPQCVLEAV